MTSWLIARINDYKSTRIIFGRGVLTSSKTPQNIDFTLQIKQLWYDVLINKV